MPVAVESDPTDVLISARALMSSAQQTIAQAREVIARARTRAESTKRYLCAFAERHSARSDARMMKEVRMSKPERRRSDKILEMQSTEESTRQSGLGDDLHAGVARRAFELFCERGGEHGQDVDDWLQAEYELMNAQRAIA